VYTVQAPLLGGFVTTSSSEPGSFTKPGIELSTIPYPEDASEEQLVTNDSSVESPDDEDCQPDED